MFRNTISLATLTKFATLAILGLGLFTGPVRAANQIPLSGTAGIVCTISVTPDSTNSTNLPITTAGAQTVQVGTVLQTCNQLNGYTLSVTSANCVAAPSGAKLVSGANNLGYSVSSSNPTTGGSANTSNLLATVCTAQIARDVTGAVVTAESSTITVLFTGNTALFPGTYTDTLTFTMTTK